MKVIEEDSFSDHRPTAIISKCQVKEIKRRGATKTRKLDLDKLGSEEMRKS